MSPATVHEALDLASGQVGLEKLAAAMDARGYQAQLRIQEGGLPCLDVRNPQASVLAERVYAHDGVFWWSWREKIADIEDVTTAAAILARVLRAVGE